MNFQFRKINVPTKEKEKNSHIQKTKLGVAEYVGYKAVQSCGSPKTINQKASRLLMKNKNLLRIGTGSLSARDGSTSSSHYLFTIK